jgi:acetyltransferase-like isoleucine patch superfamily enzyme
MRAAAKLRSAASNAWVEAWLLASLFGELSYCRTLFWNLLLRRPRLPLLIFRDVHFRAAPAARLVVSRGGRLRLGCRWKSSRFYPSEFKLLDGATLELTGSARIFTGCSIDVTEGATLSLGSAVINNGFRIAVFSRVRIGEGTIISENVTIRDSDNHHLEGAGGPVTAPVTIGDHVWIGLNATILKGVTIGDGAVVSANSLVNRDVPPNTLVGGIPAKVLKRDVSWKE